MAMIHLQQFYKYSINIIFLKYVVLRLLGGSLVNILMQTLPNISTDWSKWRFFFCDERVVPFDNGESTYGLYKTSLIGSVPITEDQFIKIDPELSGICQHFFFFHVFVFVLIFIIRFIFLLYNSIYFS